MSVSRNHLRDVSPSFAVAPAHSVACARMAFAIRNIATFHIVGVIWAIASADDPDLRSRLAPRLFLASAFVRCTL